MEEKKVLLSVQDLVVKFKVRGRSLTAIRGISLDIYDGESIAIVGESGSGKSVFTKTFANMLDSNGYVDSGKIIFNDPDLAEVTLDVGHKEDVRMTSIRLKLDAYSRLEHGADTYKAMKALEAEKKAKASISDEEDEAFQEKLADLRFERAETFNHKQTLDSHEKDKMKEAAAKISALDKQIEAVEEERKKAQQEKAKAAAAEQLLTPMSEQGVLLVSKPFSNTLFLQAIHMASASNHRLQFLRQENNRMQEKLAQVRLVSRAKCCLIELGHMTEAEAHRCIEKKAMDTRRDRAEVAQEILDSYDPAQ